MMNLKIICVAIILVSVYLFTCIFWPRISSKVKYIAIIILVIYAFLHFRRLHSSTKITKNIKFRPKNLMIVAHPDDELIFGGKMLLDKNNWKVVCVTNGTAKSQDKFAMYKTDRKAEFINAMNVIGCSYEIWDHEDNLFNANWNELILTNELYRVINEYMYDTIVTHNLQGEYGHVQHKKVSQLVYQLKPKNLYVFGHNSKTLSNTPYHLNKHTDQIIMLLEKNYKSQKHVVDKLHNYIVNQHYIKVDF